MSNIYARIASAYTSNTCYAQQNFFENSINDKLAIVYNLTQLYI